MDAREIFLARHACVHSAMMDPEGRWKEEDTIWADLTEHELRRRPTTDHNSIVWLIWHMARCEDVAVNTVLRATEEILDRDTWLAHLGITSRHIGTGATSAEVTSISQTINLEVLRAYRAAVGRETRRWATTLDFSTLSDIVSAADARRAVAHGDFGEHAAWVEEHWACNGWRRGDFLFWLGIEHNWFHIGEIWVLRSLLHHAGF